MSSLRKNYILSLITQTLTVLAPLLVTPFVARRLQADNIGIFSYTESIVFLFGLFALLGSQVHGRREIAYCQGDAKRELQTFTEIFATSGITTAIVTLGYIIFAIMQTSYRLIFYIQIIELIAFHWDIAWFYEGKENFKSLLYRNLLVKVTYIALIFVLIRTPEDLPLYVGLRVGTFLLGGATLLFPVLYQCYKNQIRIQHTAISTHIKKMIPLFIPQIAIQVYTVLDKTMIGVITQSPYQNGCYEEAMKVIRVLMNFVGAAAGVLMPRIASLYAAGNTEEISQKMFTGIRFICLTTFPIVAGLSVLASIFTPFFLGPGFDDVTILLIILSCQLLLIGIGRVTGSCLLAVKKEKAYTRNVCIGAVVNFLLNLWLISRFQAKGAAIASVIAEIIVTILMFRECRNYLSVKKFVTQAMLYLICASVMCGVLIMIKNYLSFSAFWTLSILSVTGAVIYGAILLMIKDELVLNLIKTFLQKCSRSTAVQSVKKG